MSVAMNATNTTRAEAANEPSASERYEQRVRQIEALNAKRKSLGQEPIPLPDPPEGYPFKPEEIATPEPDAPVFKMKAKVKKDRTSQYRGVSWNAKTGKWRVQVKRTDDTIPTHLGLYTSELDAARAYDRALCQFDIYRTPNFPDEMTDEWRKAATAFHLSPQPKQVKRREPVASRPVETATPKPTLPVAVSPAPAEPKPAPAPVVEVQDSPVKLLMDELDATKKIVAAISDLPAPVARRILGWIVARLGTDTKKQETNP